MTSTPSLESFLQSAKWQVKNALTDKQRITLVMGDDRADLDSIVSAILFSYIRVAHTPENAWTKTYVPLMNVTRKEISSHKTLLRLLPEVGVDKSSVITVEDLVAHGSTRSGLPAGLTRFFLLGHNKMMGRSKQDYSEKILGCIDNHPDENYVSANTDPEPRIIGNSASCTSLVVNWGIKDGASMDGDGSVAKFALAPILVATKNLTSSNTTEDDRQAAQFLEDKISSILGNFDRKAFYDLLMEGEEEESQTTSAVPESNGEPTEETTTPAQTTGDAGPTSTEDSAVKNHTIDAEAPTETETTTTEETEGTKETTEAGGVTGSISGAATAVYNYFTGGGNSSKIEETETEAEKEADNVAETTGESKDIAGADTTVKDVAGETTTLADRSKDETTAANN